MAKIRAARHYQKPDAPIALIARRGRIGLRRDWRAALPHLKGIFNRERALFLLRHGRSREIKDAVDWHHYRQVLRAVFDRWAKIYEAGAHFGTRQINGTFHQRQRRVRFRKVVVLKDIGDRFNFDRFDYDTQQKLRDAQDEMIAQLEADSRDVIETVIRNGQLQGLSPADIVDDIRNVIGLTDNQAQAVLNYESMLRNLDSGVLTRTLRDEGYDTVVTTAIDSGISMSEEQISDMVDAYESNMYDYRADMIARTESVRAANWGLHDAYRQAIDRGALTDDAVRR